MSELYISDMILRESRPRSRRLRGLGFSSKSFSGAQQEIVRDGIFDDLFEKVAVGTDTDGNPIFAIHAKYALYSDGEITAGGLPGSESEPEPEPGSAALYQLTDVAKSSDGAHVGQTAGGLPATVGQVLGFNGTSWVAMTVQGGGGVSSVISLTGDITQSQLRTALGLGNLAYQPDVVTALGYTPYNAANIGSASVAYATSAGNADTLDGQHASYFASASSLNNYLPKSGGTVTGAITFGGNDSYGIFTSSDNYCSIGTSSKAFYRAYIHNIYGNTIYENGTRLSSKYAAISALNDKQDAISDLSTIRSRSDEGHAAYNWGNHANAGYAYASSLSNYHPKGGSTSIDFTTRNLDVHGTVVATGEITAGGSSDIRLKTNIQSISRDNARNIVNRLRGVTFTWNELATSLASQNKGDSVGFVAQEIQPLIPSAIGTIFEKYLRLDTTKIIPYAVTMLQDHDERIAQLERENAELKRQLQHLYS